MNLWRTRGLRFYRISTPSPMRRSSGGLPPEPRLPCRLSGPMAAIQIVAEANHCLSTSKHDDVPGAGRQTGGGDRKNCVSGSSHAVNGAGSTSPWVLSSVAARAEPDWWAIRARLLAPIFRFSGSLHHRSFPLGGFR